MKEWRFPYYNHEKNQIDWVGLDQLDWINDMHGVEQDPIWHAEGNVYKHTKMVAEALIRLPEFHELSVTDQHIIVAAAILHDVEKRSTSTFEDGHIRSHGHAKKGAATANYILYKEIPTPLRERRSIINLVRLHGLPQNILDKKDPNREVIISSTKVDNTMLAMLAKADVLGRTADDNAQQLEKIEYFIEFCKENKCYHVMRFFMNDLSMHNYLSKEDAYVDFVKHDESKFSVVLLSGIAGSGKDSYIKNQLKGWPVVSLDDIRREHRISPTDTSGNGRVVQMAKEQAKVYMRKHQCFVWNATNLTKQMRQQLIDLFTSYGGHVTIVYIEKPYNVLIEQNRNREHVVPDNVIEKMVRKFEIPEHHEAHRILYCN